MIYFKIQAVNQFDQMIVLISHCSVNDIIPVEDMVEVFSGLYYFYNFQKDLLVYLYTLIYMGIFNMFFLAFMNDINVNLQIS